MKGLGIVNGVVLYSNNHIKLAVVATVEMIPNSSMRIKAFVTLRLFSLATQMVAVPNVSVVVRDPYRVQPSYE